ncbi:Hypothetical protein NTJ_13685 [Nesidiocoris tenuis]|uniref:Uncharacterized protein n=1 Tax=Nesidiocoris tenuis TaxID=355587 RepID=A0ABN7B9D8_9HEMI|nr:Hypothetical protein NTJ_13685 [Nesidiocoris tenuis]
MAPTINESADRRRPFTLEEYLQTSLRLKEGNGVRGTSRLAPNCKHNLSPSKVRTVMGLVAEEGRREGDSPGLPPSASPLPFPCPRRNDSAHISGSETRKHELVEMSMRTIALLKRNQALQKRLTALQIETRAFVKSALSEGSPAPDDLQSQPSAALLQ